MEIVYINQNQNLQTTLVEYDANKGNDFLAVVEEGHFLLHVIRDGKLYIIGNVHSAIEILVCKFPEYLSLVSSNDFNPLTREIHFSQGDLIPIDCCSDSISTPTPQERSVTIYDNTNELVFPNQAVGITYDFTIVGTYISDLNGTLVLPVIDGVTAQSTIRLNIEGYEDVLLTLDEYNSITVINFVVQEEY